MSLDNDRREALRLHNEARRAARGRKRPDLIWDPQLAADAESYAVELGLMGKLEHATNIPQGENLYWCSGEATLGQATEAWWKKEEKNYVGPVLDADEKKEDQEKQWGHYTQMIWPETKHVGMGLFSCPPGDRDFPEGGTYVVARYWPPQMEKQQAFRPSASNPFKYSDMRDHGQSSWEEEGYIKKYGPGHRL